jgi:PqqD family protein of HPr-rel-A system
MTGSTQRDGTRADAVPRVADEIVWVEVDGETVVYDEREKQVHLLNPTASLVWSAIDGRASLAQIAGELSRAFGAEPAVVRSDVLELVGELTEIGLLSLATRRT